MASTRIQQFKLKNREWTRTNSNQTQNRGMLALPSIPVARIGVDSRLS
ncbi:MAG: hypothetical protein HY735_20805 [Verrucomicrobia bacterium]|nr:hypothetical protein [Verrucomicrobiota bacterium]